MSEASATGRELAEQHRSTTGTSPVDLSNLSERERAGGWTFRSALVRFAQPEPVRSAVIMTFIRRAEAAILPLQALLADGRLLDVARLTDPDTHSKEWVQQAMEGYTSVSSLDEAELAVLPLVSAVLRLDDLGDHLARWAPSAPAPGPVTEVDQVCADLQRRFEELAVPVESQPPGPGRGRRR